MESYPMESVKLVINESGKAIETYSMKSVIAAVCELFDVRQEELLGKKRIAKISKARMVLYYLGYRNTSHSTTTLGNYLDRDHTTVVHGVKKCKDMMDTNNSFAYKVEQTHLTALKNEVQRREGLEQLREEVEQMITRIKLERVNGL